MKLLNLHNTALGGACISLALLFTIFSGCSLEPGSGGTSMITGKVKLTEYNTYGIPVSTYYAPEVRVYIIYGDGTTYDDDTRTSYDGTYKFTFLRKGHYQIFAYSDCLTCPGFSEVKLVEVDIDKNNSNVEAPELDIEKH